MRIAVVSDAWHPQVNGVVRALSYLQRELAEAGHEVEMITPEGYRTWPCPTYPEIRLARVWSGRLGRRLAEFAPESVHIATEGPLGLMVRRHCVRHRLPFTTSFHTRFPEYLNMRAPVVPVSAGYRLTRWFHGGAERTMVTTESLREELTSRGFENLVIWSRGVDTELFRPEPRLATEDARPVFVYMGRVAVEKNLEAFLDLDLPGTSWVVGDGPAREELEARYPEARFFGTRHGEELASIVAAADVFVFPSLTDTLGLVLLEAMACGLPVAAYPVQGPRNLVETGVNGFLDEDLGRAALRCLDIDRRQCRETALKYSWRRSMEEFVDHLAPIPGRFPEARAGGRISRFRARYGQSD